MQTGFLLAVAISDLDVTLDLHFPIILTLSQSALRSETFSLCRALSVRLFDFDVVRCNTAR